MGHGYGSGGGGRGAAARAHNALLHLFSASPELVGYGSRAYPQRSEQTSRLLLEVFEAYRAEGMAMPYTMEDFNRQFAQKHFRRLTTEQWVEAFQTLPPEERQEMLRALPLDERLAGLSAEQIRPYLERLAGDESRSARKPRRKK